MKDYLKCLPPPVRWHLLDHGSAFALTLVIGGWFYSQPYIKANQEHAMALRDKQMDLRSTEQVAKASAKVADDRYANGCVFIVARNSDNKPVSLAEGMTVLDAQTQVPLPPNTIICDGIGNTAAMNDKGTASSIAWTGNRELVNKSIKKWKKEQTSLDTSIEVRYDNQ